MNTRAKLTLSLAFKAVALGTAAVTVILVAANIATPLLYAILISIGLFCVAVASISDHPVN